jgi:hypothetical protein
VREILFIDGVSFGQHALVKDAGDQNTFGFPAVEDNVPAGRHSTKARTNIVARPAQHGIIGECLATPFKVVEIADCLAFAPGAKGIGADTDQVCLCAARETKYGY